MTAEENAIVTEATQDIIALLDVRVHPMGLKDVERRIAKYCFQFSKHRITAANLDTPAFARTTAEKIDQLQQSGTLGIPALTRIILAAFRARTKELIRP